MNTSLKYLSGALLGLAMSGTATAAVVYDHASLLDLNLTTTDMGGGSWKYDFVGTNNDSSNIWHFMVWTNSGAVTSNTGSYSSYDTGHAVPGGVASVYDATNLDASITHVVHMWDGAFGGGGGAAPGGVLSMSFMGNFFQDSFLYGYETGTSGYAVTNSQHELAAVGRVGASVPEPGMLGLMLAGFAALGFGVSRKSRKE